MRRISPKADFLLPQEMSRLEKGSFISHQKFLELFLDEPPMWQEDGLPLKWPGLGLPHELLCKAQRAKLVFKDGDTF